MTRRMTDFEDAIHRAHVRQVQTARLFAGRLLLALALLGTGMGVAAWLMGGA